MKKLLVSLLILGMSVSMVACGSASDSSTAGTAATDEDNYISDLEDDEDVSETDETVETDTDEEVFLESFNTSPTIQETVLWDEQNVKVTATSLEYGSHSADLNLTFENNSDVTLYFRTGVAAYDKTSVNGYMMPEYLSVEVASGESEEDELSFSTTTLMGMGINEIADITFGFWFEDDDYNDFYLDPVTLETSASNSYNYDEDPYLNAINSGTYARRTGNIIDYHSEDVIFDKSDISIISETLTTRLAGDYDDYDTVALLMEAVNQSEYDIYIELSDIYVNDELIYDGFWSIDELTPKTRNIIGIDIASALNRYYIPDDENEDPQSLIENGVKSVSFTITIDNESGDEALSPETITLTFD